MQNASPQGITYILRAVIRPSRLNPRTQFEPEGLQELADSIREHGILEPLIVRPMISGETEEPYELIAGERRWRAAEIAGLSSVPCIVRPDVDDHTALKLMLIENLIRAALNPIEEAAGYRKLQELGMKQREIADSVKRSQPAVANAMRLLDLPRDVQERIRTGELTPSHGVAIASYKAFPKLASYIAKRAVSQNLTTKQVEKILDDDYTITSAGVVRLIDYGTAFDKSVCQRCPFDAYRKRKYGGGLCLKPEHYDQLQEQGKEAQRLEAQKAIEVARAKGQAEVPKLDDMRGTPYRHVSPSAPEGCRQDCQYRETVIGFRGEVQDICVNVGCHESLRAAEEKAKKQRKQEQHKEQRTALIERMHTAEIDSRGMAILVSEILPGKAPTLVKEIYCRVVGVEPKDVPTSLTAGSGDRRKAAPDLISLSPLHLLRFGVELLLRDELHCALELGYGGDRGRVDWYLGLEPEKPAKGESAATLVEQDGEHGSNSQDPRVDHRP